ncbi:MAG: hypothetical protein ACOZNI_04075 [Myxococcota bacterium]
MSGSIGSAEALLEALQPKSFGERIRLLTSGGWTAAQVHARLPPHVRARFDAERQPVEALHRELVALAAAGLARHRRVRWAMPLNTKGVRDMVVDVFRV